MAKIKTEATMEEFLTNNQANYYSGNTSITIDGKAAYELKGKFVDDLRNNAFSGTNGEDAVEHIEYFLKIVDPIDLPNANYERLRLAVFPISLVGNASKWFDEFKGSIITWEIALTSDPAICASVGAHLILKYLLSSNLYRYLLLYQGHTNRLPSLPPDTYLDEKDQLAAFTSRSFNPMQQRRSPKQQPKEGHRPTVTNSEFDLQNLAEIMCNLVKSALGL
ncbi:hypothetical protein Tco_0714847 [Tanacetum coccineum]